MSADSIFLAQYLRDRAVIQGRLDAILAAVEATRTEDDLRQRAILYKCFTAAGLTIGSGDAKKVKITDTVIFHNDGLLKSKASAESTFSTTASTTLAISSWCKYLVTLNASGTPKITEGNHTTVNAAAALLPAVPTGETPIGYLQVATDGTGTFVPDTDDLSDGAVTDTYVDLAWPDSGVDALTVLSATGLSALGAMQPISG